ncbi:Sec1 family superfamily [Stachybotrys elegans]|uniref:Sec1 family superfamily n=1 Tax=Stachybotrys elegans TaxID=80388 RepID=A0A8K0WNE9_9HYPO|nr:Sec1 family superfamily [Stachybotrys elegans]
MGLSVIQEQHDVILNEIKNITRGDWKCLIVDEKSKKIIDNVVKEDDILNNNIATIERIEERREPNPGMDAIYILTPEPHIVDCLLADFDRRRYRTAFLVWTSLIDPGLRRRIDEVPGIRQLRASSRTLFVDFFPRESHLVTFRDPWSFPMLYHPACNSLVPAHMQALAQKIAGVCITLGEYPKVRYYKPANALHEASVLCAHLARFVQEELDGYAQWDPNFPPPSNRPQATLVVTDRSMDIMAPLIHEFTYQAMSHDLLPIKEHDKVIFTTTINEGTAEAQEKDMELSEKDKIWVDNRHRHMKDTIDKLMSDFQKFLEQNPHFTDENTDTTSLNAIRDMLAGLPQFQEMKEAYSLHLTMAQECMNIFERNKLPDLASIEQTMSTGLDEDLRKPKNVLDSVVRLLDDDSVSSGDRLRLVMIYILYRDGVIMEDIKRLLAHAALPSKDGETIVNLELLGGRTSRGLKDVRQPSPALFPKDPRNMEVNEEYALSRYEPILKTMLDHVSRGVLDQNTFPYVKPPLDPNEDMLAAQGGSLRAGRPNWAAAGRRQPENRQRLIVFMAGGATYSESRACYEIGNERSRDVVLVTSHMLTPQLFIRQVGDLSRDRRQLDLPMDRPKPRAPAHLFERPAPTPPPPSGRPQGPGQPMTAPPRPGGGRPMAGGLPSRPVAPPTQAMGNMNLNASPQPPSNGTPAAPPGGAGSHDDGGKHKEKKRRNLFGMKK